MALMTETGAHMIAPLPGVWPQKPGSASLPFFGVAPVLLNEQVSSPRPSELIHNLEMQHQQKITTRIHIKMISLLQVSKIILHAILGTIYCHKILIRLVSQVSGVFSLF